MVAHNFAGPSVVLSFMIAAIASLFSGKITLLHFVYYFINLLNIQFLFQFYLIYILYALYFFTYFIIINIAFVILEKVLRKRFLFARNHGITIDKNDDC